MSQEQTLSVQQAYAHSLEYFENARLKPAITTLNKIIAAAPKFAPAHQLIGIIALQLGQIDAAEKAMRTAIRLHPNNPAFLTNFVETLRRSGKADEAISVGKRAVQIAPNDPKAHSNLGLSYYDTGNIGEAEASQKRALSFDPDFAPALNNLGSIAHDNDDDDAAMTFYRKVLKENPNYLETANNLISVLIENEALEDATKLADDYLARASKSADLHRNRGRLHVLAKEWDAAEARFREAIGVDETKPEPHVGLAQVLFEKNHPDLALLEAEKALRLDPDHAPAHHYIAMCKAQLGDIEAGLSSYEKALSLKPDFTASMIAIGHLEMEKGDFKAARRWFEKAATHERAHLSAHIAMARLGKVATDDPSFQVLRDALQDVPTMQPDQSVAFHYALGKCYEDVRRYGEAFEQFAAGATVKRKLIDFDPNQIEETSGDIIATFSLAFIDQLRPCANESDQPIFVVGMPRSGTTLTEAILASHPKVFGAGELKYLHALFSDRQTGGTKKTGGLIAKMSPKELSSKARQFVELLNANAPGSPRIVDKMPANFQMIGLIHALLPNAKIIHVARNPIDTCLSCFTRVFERSQYHTYDLVELGRYFNAYVRMMNHWKVTLPEGSFHTVHYENLVDDIEHEAKRMIAHCELEWNDACLEFYRGERRVRTASVQQVRQPLYVTSKEKWRLYEAQLGPLIKTIGDTQILF